MKNATANKKPSTSNKGAPAPTSTAATLAALNSTTPVAAASGKAPASTLAAAAAGILASLPENAPSSVGVPVAKLANSLIRIQGAKAPAPYPTSYKGAPVPATFTLGSKLQGGANPARGALDVAAVAAVQAITGPITQAALLKAGIHWHTLRTYINRGWLVATK